MVRWFSFLLLSALPTLSAATRTENLVAVWHFDEPIGTQILDASGQGHHGRVVGATRVDGLFGKALAFDGVDDYAVFPGVGVLREGTVEAWVRLEGMSPRQSGFVTFGHGYGFEYDTACLGCAHESAQAPLSMASFGVCSHAWHVARQPRGLRLMQWHHVAGVWGPSGLRFYVDGALAAEKPSCVCPLPSHRAVLLAADSSKRHAACLLDEVRIYAAALAPEALRDHFEARTYVASPPQLDESPSQLSRSAVGDVSHFYDPDDPTCGIQAAVDSLPPQGGVVTVPPGRYVLRRAIHLDSNVTLAGAGPSTILTRGPLHRTRLAKTGRQGDRTVAVEDAKGFRVGREVGIFSRRVRSWLTTHAVITAIEGRTLTIDPPLKQVYEVEDAAATVDAFPAIYAAHRANVEIRDLCIDGNVDGTPELLDFTFEAIHLWDTSDSIVRRCMVRHWPSDGIGVQQGTNVKVLHCTAAGCLGHGFHPGTSLKHAIFDGNVARHNGQDGFYFCASCHYLVVSNNVLHDNGGSGIGGLGGGGDRFNIVCHNVCQGNGKCGIEAVGGTENVISGNVCTNNSQARPGFYPAIFLLDATCTTVSGNHCTDSQQTPTQLAGILESGDADRNVFTANNLASQPGKGLVVRGPQSKQVGNLVADAAGAPQP